MERHFGMDWLRIGAFGVLILYHVGMFFVPWGWHVKTAEPIAWATIPMLAANAWRLGLLFAVSGFASAALLAKRRRLGAFLGSRSARLLVPLLFGMVVVVVPQPWAELVTQHGYPNSFWHFWAHDYFRFTAIDGVPVPTWQHLWFVVYLWVYTLLLVLLLAAIPARVRGAIAGFAERALSGPLVLAVPIALLWANSWLSWPLPDETHALVDDWGAHRIYFPIFLFGFLLAGAPGVWTAIRRWWKLAAALAVLAYAVVAAIMVVWLGGIATPFDLEFPFELARGVQGWCAIVALIGVADRFWNRDHPWRATLTEAVFPFYVIHQTIIVVLGWWLLRFALPAGVEFAILVPATAAGCWLFYLGGRALPWLRPLIGLRLARKPASAREAASVPGVP